MAPCRLLAAIRVCLNEKQIAVSHLTSHSILMNAKIAGMLENVLWMCYVCIHICNVTFTAIHSTLKCIEIEFIFVFFFLIYRKNHCQQSQQEFNNNISKKNTEGHHGANTEHCLAQEKRKKDRNSSHTQLISSWKWDVAVIYIHFFLYGS